ncbi:MAG: tRNA guanosine(34) transglycosylase Tgt [Pseudomonadota bacterium]
MTAFAFKLQTTDGAARRGTITTARGEIQTPAFMPVGTAATVKALYPEQVADAGADILLGNTYHLMLRPGAERIARLGGLHDFMRWQKPILTDSGGFQVMSLAGLRKMSEDGATFKSHLDGTEYHLTPERSIEIQCLLGADIQMQLDECISLPAPFAQAEAAMELSVRWARRSKQAFHVAQDTGRAHAGQALFGIVQGGTEPELRRRSTEALVEIGFPGYAVGGLAVGEGHDAMVETLEVTLPHMPADKPRYLMGVGTPKDLIAAVARGIDMFDCVMPTRSGRHGQAFTWAGKVNLKNAHHGEDLRPLDEASACPASRDYSRAYLHHLIRSNEYLGSMLITWANTWFYQDLMCAMRTAIVEGRFGAFVDTHLERLVKAEPR